MAAAVILADPLDPMICSSGSPDFRAAKAKCLDVTIGFSDEGLGFRDYL